MFCLEILKHCPKDSRREWNAKKFLNKINIWVQYFPIICSLLFTLSVLVNVVKDSTSAIVTREGTQKRILTEHFTRKLAAKHITYGNYMQIN